MSSRSLGLFAGFFVSQGRSSPASCLRMSSGSSVRKRMRPCNLTLSGRFSILRSRSESITLNLRGSEIEGRPKTWRSLSIVTPRGGSNPVFLRGLCGEELPNHRGHRGTLGTAEHGNLSLVIVRIGQRIESAAGEDFFELVHQRRMDQPV